MKQKKDARKTVRHIRRRENLGHAALPAKHTPGRQDNTLVAAGNAAVILLPQVYHIAARLSTPRFRTRGDSFRGPSRLPISADFGPIRKTSRKTDFFPSQSQKSRFLSGRKTGSLAAPFQTPKNES